MAYSAFIEILDRLSVKSIFRGSTATWFGIVGTLTVVILCLAIYIPPTVAYFKGNYFETQFYTQQIVKQNFYSDDDFKIAVIFRHKVNSSVANHSDIIRFAYSTAAEESADQEDYYEENMLACDSNYFSQATNPIVLEDCFIFPNQVKFNLFYFNGFYSSLFYFLYPHYDSNPFTGREGGPLSSFQSQLENLLKNYYYEVLFTSKIIDGAGKNTFEVNRFFSTESEPTSLVGTSWNEIIFNVKKTNMDISIMPWINNITQSNMVWLGQIYTGYQLNPTQSAIYGVEVVFSEYIYQISSFRYYKKLDWLVGIIGGAMLLFYIILWVPCNYINKTLHKIRNTEALLLIDLTKEGEQTDEIDLFPAKVSFLYWFSNLVTNCISQKIKKESRLVQEGQRQLDVAHLIKKLKVVQRSFVKKNINNIFAKKVLNLFEAPKRNENIQIGEASNADIDFQTDQNSIINDEQNKIYEGELILVQIPTDTTNNFTIAQENFFKDNHQIAKQVYINNQTILAILNEEAGYLKDLKNQSKWSARSEDSPVRVKCLTRLFYGICDIIEQFDFFGARPNLIADPYNSSCVGCIGTIFIIVLTILTVALTISNVNVPQMMILNENLEGKDFNYTLVSGQSLKMAACFSWTAPLKGSSRLANLRFFSQSKSRGRQYISAVPLTNQDYSLFDLTSSTAPIPLTYCFGMDPNHKILMGKTKDDFGYFGFRVEPYCASTPGYCSSTSSSTVNSFLTYINSTYVYPLLPENRFDPATKKFINNLVYQPVNINNRYMTNASAMEETIFVDKVEIQDDTKNFFMRKQYEVSYEGIAINANSPYTIAKNIPGKEIYYEVKIRPSINQINYLVTTPKADILLGIIGGVFVIWYAILHWMGKLYNSYNPRAQLAKVIYDEQFYDQYPFFKMLTFLPVPLCLIPSCFGIKKSINRMRIFDQKIKNDLHYLSLVKYVDNVFKLSSALFGIDKRKNEFVYEQRNLSLVFVKEKIDESALVKPEIIEQQEEHSDRDFMEMQQIIDEEKMTKNTRNKVTNSSIRQKQKKNNQQKDFSQKEKHVIQNLQKEPQEELNDNRINGHPKQFPVSWLDSFEYTASLTFKGKREVTSCCGGCCCLILLMFIAIIASFQVGIYLDRSDSRVGMTTEMMQPLATQSNATYNSKLHLITGTNFKLAVTFSTQYNDYPHDVANYTSVVGMSVFQKTFMKSNGTIKAIIQQYPLITCQSDYLTAWLSPVVDSSYYDHTQLGFCIPDGILLEIDGLPEDQITKSFTISIYNKNGSSQTNTIVQQFLMKYLPKYHFSNPSKNFETKAITYDITTLVFDPMNISAPVQQNLTLSKMLIKYDNQIAFEGDPVTQQTYSYNSFRQYQTAYYGSLSQKMYYNLTFDNSHLVEIYYIQGDKFYQTWGIIGGLIAFFIFGFGVIARSFNNYRMKYLIGKELYLFDMLKVKEAKRKARQNDKKSTQQARQMNKINNLTQGHIVAAYILSFFGGIMRNYNWPDVLRRVTIIQQKVEKDLSLFEVYKKVHLMRDELNKYFKQTHNIDIKLADIYPKHIYNSNTSYYELQDAGRSKLKSFARKHGWSAYEQRSILEALQAHVNLRNVFDNDFLDRSFDVFASEQSVRLSQYEGTVFSQSIGTNSMADRYELAREHQQD